MIAPLILLGTILTLAVLLFRSVRSRNRAVQELETLRARQSRSENSRSEIIVELAHDLRTPLTSILTVFESIQGSTDPDYIRKGIAVALPEVDYVNHLINDLFLLSQMQEPGYRPKQESVDLVGLLREEVEKASALSQAGKKIRFELLPETPSLHAASDSFLLRRLLKNLLSNAGKFSASQVKVTLEALGSQGVRISVIDDGPGFVAEDDPLGDRRPDLNGKTAASSSIGLGSVIIRKIAQLNGGFLRTFNRMTKDGKVKGAVVEVTLDCRLLNAKKPAA